MKLLSNKLNLLTEVITSADSIISITSEIDAVILGILKLSNDTKKIIQFSKASEDSNTYRARLVLSSDDLPLLDSSLFYFELSNSELTQTTTPVKLTFDKEKIKLNIKKDIDDQYKSIIKAVAKLDEKISALTTGKTLNSLPIRNKTTIQPGMIPVAIDDKGNFVAMYPFADYISSINGNKGVDGSINIDSSMIEYKKNGKTIEQALDDQADAIRAVMNLINEIAENQKAIQRQLNEVDMKIETHINNGII